MANIQELLKRSNELKAKIKAQQQELKQQKSAMALEFTAGLSDEQKQKQIADAQKILESVKQKAEALKREFKAKMGLLKDDAKSAKELLEFVNYKINNQLPKIKNGIAISDGKATIKREGIKDIVIDVTKADYQKTIVKELAKQGIENGVARNIAYKTSMLVKSNA